MDKDRTAQQLAIEKLRTLARRLIQGTRENKITWDETDRDQAYTYSTKDASVIIATTDNDGFAPFQLLIVNDQGNVVDSLESHERILGTRRIAPLEWAGELRELHALARRDVYRVDELVSTLLDGLPADPGPIPEQVEARIEDDEPPF